MTILLRPKISILTSSCCSLLFLKETSSSEKCVNKSQNRYKKVLKSARRIRNLIKSNYNHIKNTINEELTLSNNNQKLFNKVRKQCYFSLRKVLEVSLLYLIILYFHTYIINKSKRMAGPKEKTIVKMSHHIIVA